MFDTTLKEIIHSSSYMIGVSEVGPNVREITLLALLDEGGALTNNDGTRIPQKEINEITDIAIVWNYDDDNSGDINVEQIYNHETGEVYFEDHVENWTDGDELIVNEVIVRGLLTFPEESVTDIVQSEKVPSKALNVIVLLSVVADVVLEEQEPPYVMVPASSEEKV